MDYFARGYTALVGDKGIPQSANDTIEKLCDRLLNNNQLEERRAALLGLKGLSRDWKSVEFVIHSSSSACCSYPADVHCCHSRRTHIWHTVGSESVNPAGSSSESGGMSEMRDVIADAPVPSPPQEVGARALPILLGVLQDDAPDDIETAKAVVETLSLLCEIEEVDGRVSLLLMSYVKRERERLC